MAGRLPSVAKGAGPAAAGQEIKLDRPDRSHAIVMHSESAVLTMPPEPNNEPDTEDDAAKKEEDANERPE